MRLVAAAAALLLTTTSMAQIPEWRLTPSGWGPVRIGMTRQQVSRALKIELEGEAFDNEGACIELYGQDESLPGFYFMFLDGKLSRISIGSPSLTKTPSGIGIGAAVDEIRKAYGEGLKEEPHHYLGEPAEYLTYWLKPEVRGVRFETDAQQKVESIHAGNASIQYIEGCA